MKAKTIFGLIVLVILSGCKTGVSTEQTARVIRSSFALADSDKIEILENVEEAKDLRMVKFSVNGASASVKMREVDKAWTVEQVQDADGNWVAVSALEEEAAALEKKVQGAVEQLENAYSRRSDLIPNLLELVKDEAELREAGQALFDVRQKARESQEAGGHYDNPESFAAYRKLQDDVRGALEDLITRIPYRPAVHANPSYQDLKTQLEGGENRIAVERRRYDEAAKEFNQKIGSILMTGKKPDPKPVFSETAERP